MASSLDDKGKSSISGGDEERKHSLLSRDPQVSTRPLPPGRTLSRTPSQLAQSGWSLVAKYAKSGVLHFVGLKPQKEERLHWDAVQQSIRENRLKQMKTSSPSMMSMQSPTTAYQQQMSTVSSVSAPAAAPPPPSLGKMSTVPSFPTAPSASAATRRLFSDSDKVAGEPATLRQLSLYNKQTGRNQAVRTELKPDIWKAVYLGVKKLGQQRREQTQKSFIDLGEDSDEEVERVEETDFAPSHSIIPPSLPPIEEQEDESFFGEEKPRVTDDQPDAAIGRYAPSLPPLPEEPTVQPKERPSEPTPPSSPLKKRRIGLPSIIHDPLFGGYDRGYGGLGLPTLLLQFKYKECPHSVQQELDRQLLHRRPYFTYWLMFVHIVIMIISLSVYGFAPYGWDRFTESRTIRQSNLAFETTRRNVIPSVWGGPRQMDLVLLGALYAPCMRRDRQLFGAIDGDIRTENTSSGCCVRRDESGCVQVEQSDCPARFADFFQYNENNQGNVRAVCGTSPLSCTNPNPNFFSDSWIPSDITTWPICQTQDENQTEVTLTCDLTGRPCCVGIQGNCRITTREECDFLLGRFHQDAFLCSQVDCMNDICGLLPFRVFNQPDQVYRLWLALFLHAGLIHLFFSLLFTFFVLRHVEKRLGWFRTTFLHVVSGIGGNLVSVYFVPYNPGVGPAASILGIVAYFFIFLLFESRFLVKPWVEFLKLVGVVVVLFLLGLLPFIDNLAHIGGFVFGLFTSGIIIPYGPYRKLQEHNTISSAGKDKKDVFLIIKIVLVLVGIPVVLAIFVLFFLLFYLVQDTWVGFGYLSCIPFTSTICNDVRPILRSRGEFFV